MAAWQGWQDELLAALHEPDSAHNKTFLEEWEAAEHTVCHSNPLAASLHFRGSTRCKELAHGVYAQAYTSHANGLQATVTQLSEGTFTAIRAVLHSGDPFSFTDWQEVVGQLGIWGAHVFARQYADAMKGFGSGGGGGVGDASRSLHAYGVFSKTLAHKFPASLYRAQKMNRETLAKLRR